VITPKVGPLTKAELQQVWERAVDKGFREPIEQAGEGGGFEAYTQAWAQGERVSKAIDTTTQAMFVLPWSGQSDEPASGSSRASVTLTLTRSGLLSLPLVLIAGTLVDEQITDWGYPEGVRVLTGRRYVLTDNAVFAPGETGPITVAARAERPGAGYNNPMPGTLVVIDQPGTNFTNVEATVRGVNYPGGVVTTSSLARVFLDAIDVADAFVPQHVGQYVAFTAGTNTGKVARAIGWLPPNLSVTPQTGGTLELALEQSVRSFAGDFTGTFEIGEKLELMNGASVVGYGLLLGLFQAGADLVLTFQKQNGAAATDVVGMVSGATAAIDVELENLDLTPEVETAGWRVLDWVIDWQVRVTNTASPTGGKAAMLDALGREKDIDRAPAESDDQYRVRVAQLADVVSPNAIRRALNRAIPGIPWCFREAGQPSYPGFFFDKPVDVHGAGGDAFDYDLVVASGIFTGVFLDGEKVSQTSAAGIVTTAVVYNPVGPAPFVPGPPAPFTSFAGFASIRGKFTIGDPIVGLRSGAVLVPSGLTAGLMDANRFRVLFSYLTMRAYFYVGVPTLSFGEFGFAFDDYPTGAFDAEPYDDFFDGSPYLSSLTYQSVYAAIEKVRAGGVGWELLLDDGPCP